MIALTYFKSHPKYNYLESVEFTLKLIFDSYQPHAKRPNNTKNRVWIHLFLHYINLIEATLCRGRNRTIGVINYYQKFLLAPR